MELTQLKQFKTIAECGTIISAAEILYTTPSALSKALSKLEDELGVQLFDRTKKSLELNDAGKLALEYVNRALETLNEMTSLLLERSVEKSQNVLHLASTKSFILRLVVPSLLSRFSIDNISEQVMDLRLLEKGLLEHTYDLGLSHCPLSHRELVCRHLYTNHLYVSIPERDPLSHRTGILLRDLSGKQFCIPNNRDYLDMNKLAETKAVNLVFRTVPDYSLYRDILEHSDLLSFAATSTLRYHSNIPGRKLIRVLDDDGFSSQVYYVYHKSEADTAKLQAFIQWIDADFIPYIHPK